MGDPVEMDPKRITRRLMRLNMVAIHTTSVTITNALLDLYSSPRVEEYVAGLREECERVLKQHGGQWNKTAVNELYRIDSTIKESMRFSSLGITGLMRKVRVRESVCHCYRTPLPTSSEILPPLLHRSPFAIIDKRKKNRSQNPPALPSPTAPTSPTASKSPPPTSPSTAIPHFTLLPTNTTHSATPVPAKQQQHQQQQPNPSHPELTTKPCWSPRAKISSPSATDATVVLEDFSRRKR